VAGFNARHITPKGKIIMSKSSNTSAGGIGFCGLLAVAFIVLKLCNVIQWSWWWVLAPLWIPAAIVIVLAVIVLICALISGGVIDD